MLPSRSLSGQAFIISSRHWQQHHTDRWIPAAEASVAGLSDCDLQGKFSPFDQNTFYCRAWMCVRICLLYESVFCLRKLAIQLHILAPVVFIFHVNLCATGCSSFIHIQENSQEISCSLKLICEHIQAISKATSSTEHIAT